MSLSAAQAGLLVEAPKKGRPVDANAAQPWTIPFPDAPELLEYDNGYEIKEDLYAKYQERRLQELSGFLTRMQEKLKKRELTVGVLMPERPELGPIITAFRRLGAKIEGIPKKNYQSDMSHMFRHELLVSYAYQPRKYWRRLTGGNHTLVVEKAYFRGKIKGRYEQSYSWDGVNNRGLHPTGHGGRWSAMRKVLRPKPWKRVCPKTVLLLGQERFDRTQYPIRRRYGSSSAFIQSMINRLKEKAPSLTILFRAHPEEIKKSGGKYFRPYGAKDVSKEDFMKTMARSQLVVTGNSGAAVEAMLMGIPVLAGDVGFMGWQCSLHRIDELSSMNLRSHDECFHQIAVSQWSATDLLRGGLPYIMNPAHYQFATQQPPPSQFNVTCAEL